MSPWHPLLARVPVTRYLAFALTIGCALLVIAGCAKEEANSGLPPASEGHTSAAANEAPRAAAEEAEPADEAPAQPKVIADDSPPLDLGEDDGEDDPSPEPSPSAAVDEGAPADAAGEADERVEAAMATAPKAYAPEPPPVLSSVEGVELRAWLAAKPRRGKIKPGKLSKPARRELEELLDAIDPTTKAAWLEVLAVDESTGATTLVVSASFGKEKDPVTGKSASTNVTAVMRDEEGRFVMRSYVAVRRGKGDKSTVHSDLDIDGDTHPDLVIWYESSASGGRYDGLVVVLTRWATVSNVAMAEQVDGDHVVHVRSACWTQIETRPALVMVLEHASKTRGEKSDDTLRWETDVYVTDGQAKLAMRPVVALLAGTGTLKAAQGVWSEVVGEEAPGRVKGIEHPGLCKGGSPVTLIIPSANVIALSGKVELKAELVVTSAALSDEQARVGAAGRIAEEKIASMPLVRFGRDAR